MALRHAAWTLSLLALLAAGSLPAGSAQAAARSGLGKDGTADARPVTVPAAAPGGKVAISAYLEGTVAFERKDWAAAAAALAVAQRSDPSDMDLARRTFLALLAADRMDQAQALAEKLDAAGESSHLTRALRVIEALRANKLDEAAKLAADMPDDGLGIYIKPIFNGWVQALQGRTDEALATMASLRNAPGFATMYQIDAGVVLAAANRMDEAQQHFQDAVALSPRVQRINTIAAAVLARAGRTDAAKKILADYLKAVPLDIEAQVAADKLAKGEALEDPVPARLSGLAEALGGVGSALLSESATDIAILYAQLAREADPDRLALDILVGDIQSTDGDIPAALNTFRTASASPQANPADRYMAKLKMADMLSRQKRDEEAKTALEQLVADWPERIEAKRELGHLYRRQENYAKAVELYTQVLDSVPDDVTSIWPVYYSRAVCADKLGNWTLAEADLNKALKLSPDQPYLLNYLGYSWIDRGTNVEEGKRLIHKALEQRPNDGHIVDSLGWAHFKLGELPDAVTWMEKAVEMEPLDAVINDHLGDVYWEAGRYTEARFSWTRALEHDDDHELETAKVQAKLDRPTPPRKAGLSREAAAKQPN